MDNFSPQEKAYFTQLFQVADADKDEKIGLQDAAFFRKAGLPDQALGKIWQSSDVQQKGFLNAQEFYFALRMVSLAQNGKDITREAAANPQPLPNFPDYPPKAASTPSPSSSSTDVSQWTIPPSERQKYIEYFRNADADNDGFVTGVEAKNLFSKSGLEMGDLAKIWKLSDVNQDMKLDQEEFIIAMFLINCRRRGITLPDTLPAPLLPGAPKAATPPSTPPSTPLNATPSAQPGQTQWKITEEDKKKAIDIFKRAQPDGEHISGETARSLFSRSGLSTNDLGKIWGLADMDKDGKLSQPEFIIAMHFIYSKLKGIEIPDAVPESMKADVGLASHASAPLAEPAKPPAKKLGNYEISLDDLNPTPVAPTVPSTALAAPLNGLSTNNPGQFGASFPTSFGAPLSSNSFGTIPPSTNSMPAMPAMPVNSTGSMTSLPTIPPIGTNSMPNIPGMTAAPGRRDDLAKQLAEEKATNALTENHVNAERSAVESTSNELRELETKVAEEKARGVALKEQLKYLQLQLRTVKEQKEQFQKILAEKTEQRAEEEELYNMLMTELNEKKAELEKFQEQINAVTSGTESLRIKRKEAKEQLSSLKTKMDEFKGTGTTSGTFAPVATNSNPSFTAASFTSNPFPASTTSGSFAPVTNSNPSIATPATQPAKKEPPPIPSKPTTPPQNPGFGEDFGSSTFDSFGAPSTAKAEPKVATTSKSSFDSFGQDAFGSNHFDSFGQDAFGSSNFGSDTFGSSNFGSVPSQTANASPNVTKPPLPGKKPDDDPFSFSADLSGKVEDPAKDSFGAKPTAANNGFGFGSDNFGFSDNFGEFGAPSNPPQQQAKPVDAFDNSGFGFPSNLAEFDTGKDSFG